MNCHTFISHTPSVTLLSHTPTVIFISHTCLLIQWTTNLLSHLPSSHTYLALSCKTFHCSSHHRLTKVKEQYFYLSVYGITSHLYRSFFTAIMFLCSTNKPTETSHLAHVRLNRRHVFQPGSCRSHGTPLSTYHYSMTLISTCRHTKRTGCPAPP